MELGGGQKFGFSNASRVRLLIAELVSVCTEFKPLLN
jgi:hypothetical protein